MAATRTLDVYDFAPTPGCSSGTPTDFHCQSCTTNAVTAQLLYWPLQATGEPCDDKSTTIGPTLADQPNTAVISDTTFTSPSVYLSIPNVNAYEDFWVSNDCGSYHGPTVAAMPPADLSSLRFSYTRWSSYNTKYSRTMISYRGLRHGRRADRFTATLSA